MTLAAVFGGGGVRGAFQAGVWATIAPVIQPRFVIGSSIGAINGLATTRLTPEEIVAWWLQAVPERMRPYQVQPIQTLIKTLGALPVRSAWPALAVSTSVGRHRPHVVTLSADNAERWLLASSALPGWYAPRRIDGQWYVDGGVSNDLPVAIARDLGATDIVAISAAGFGPTPGLAGTPVIAPPSNFKRMLDFSLTNRRALIASGREAGSAWLRQREIKQEAVENFPERVQNGK